MPFRKSNLQLVREMLEYGTNPYLTNRERKFFYNFTFHIGNAVTHYMACKMYIKYTLINKFSKGYEETIELFHEGRILNCSNMSNYLDDCVSEILQMKTDEIKDGLPLYEFVTNSIKECNNQLSVRLANVDFLHYPIYKNIILGKIKPFLARAYLLKNLAKIQCYTILVTQNQNLKGKKIVLDYDSTHIITEYLSNENLFNFIIAFDDSNKLGVQSLSSLNDLVKPGLSLHKTAKDIKRAKTLYVSKDIKRARLK